MQLPLILQAHLHVVHFRPCGLDASGQPVLQVIGEEEAHNLVTDAGRVGIHTYIYGTSTQRSSASPAISNVGLNYVALSDNSTAVAAGDTSLTGELTGSGLDRAQGTVTLPTGSGTVTTISRTFTFTGASQSVRKTCLFDASTGGRMAHEILFSPRTLANGDSLTVQFSITLA